MSNGERPPTNEDLIPAATVVLARDRPEGPEILMLRRNSTIAFGGAWVFPGGRVDDTDPGSTELEQARSAAIRESEEETGLDISDRPLATWSLWVPPKLASMVGGGKRRRYSTWFFIAEAPENDVEVDMGEIHDHRWLRPADALRLQQEGELELIPPTWVTLLQLSRFDSVRAAIAARHRSDPDRFITRPHPGPPQMLIWDGDVAYDNPDLILAPGGRNRLVMADRNWSYERR